MNCPPLMQQIYGVNIGTDYPLPIVDHSTATKSARDRIFSRRKQDAVRAEARRVLIKHGSPQADKTTKPRQT